MDDIQKTVKIDFSTGTNSTPDTGICDCGGIFVFDTQRRIHICNKCKIIKRTVSKKQFQPGETVADRYKILKLLAQGGMGYIYLCTSTEDCSVRYVLKTMNLPRLIAAQHQFDTEQRRIMREAKLLNALDHPNIVKVYDSWQDDSNTYIVMEYINGSNLAQVKRVGEYEFDEANVLRIMYQIADALQYAWESQRILHRDIKPENIMLDENGHLRLLDFGIAKSLTANNTTALTTKGSGLGTPGYMSPEQFSSNEALNCTTDIYSLGATAYFLLTGSPPYTGKNALDIFGDMLDHEPELLHKINPAISENMSVLIRSMMRFAPADRPFSWRKLKMDLDLVMNGLPPRPN